MSKWIEPFGFTKEESVLNIGADTEIVVLLAVLILDVLTLPLAILWVPGIGRDESV